MKRVQVIATIGPASGNKNVLKKMIGGKYIDIARLNFSWGSYEGHKNFIENIRLVSKEENHYIKIIADLSGPRVSSGSGHKRKISCCV